MRVITLLEQSDFEMASKCARGKLDISRSIFVLCDMQVGLREYIWCFAEIAAVAQNMVGIN